MALTEHQRAARNLDPHKPARMAMWLWGAEYSRQHGGSMDFWDSLDKNRKELCRRAVREIDAARAEGKE